MTILLWLRRDLRLADNPALQAALTQCHADDARMIPVYIADPAADDQLPSTAREGGASRWWQHHSLAALQQDLDRLGSRLIIRRGAARNVLDALVRETGANAVYWNRQLTPAAIARDRAIKQRLQAEGIAAHSFNAALLHEPWQILTRQGTPFRVFSAYWRAAVAAGIDQTVLAAPGRLPPVPAGITGVPLDALNLLPDRARSGDWTTGLAARWTPGESGAWARLDAFVDRAAEYAEHRNFMAIDGTSGLSAHLHFGEIGPRQIVARLRERFPDLLDRAGCEQFVRELGWREFSAYLLYHVPQTLDHPLDDRFARFAWRDHDGEARADLLAWQRGRTGIPLVDAAMRCLWVSGWMHNRTRMVVASFLTKNLLIDWRIGAAWFMDTLIDADPASNTAGWQWVAGSGADAAPYFRIFNPVLQAEKFDPDGVFIRRWVPELAALPDKALLSPWTAPAALEQADIRLGRDYPEPIVDLKASRRRALDRFGAIKNTQAI